MFKKVIATMLVLLCGSALVFAQTAMVKPQGISPRDASADDADIFDRAYNGLLNVGVETQMYLKGMVAGAGAVTPTWTVLTAPSGSVADVTTTLDVNDSTQVAVFTPDVLGTYKVEFAGGGAADTVTINAALYVGAGSGDGNCVLCHQGKAGEWKETGHSSMLVRGLEGTLSDHYASYCIGCHTTGYDADAANNGFDDFDFVFPDSLFAGMYDSMKTMYPDAMKLANIQCEACHGPGSAHNGDTSDNKMVATLSADDCAWCHDSGTHHVYPEQWDVSVHANPQYAGYAGGRASCAPCHSGAGFVKFVEGGKVGLDEAPPVTAITCASCHDPHSVEHPHQLRTVEVTLGNGMEVEGGGLGKLCMNCHKSRRNSAEYTGPDWGYSSHYGPHHGPQADILIGTNMPTFGKKLPSSAHFAAIENGCVGCHMAEGHADDEGNIILSGSHSFSMSTPEGIDNVGACEECHGNIGESFHEKKFYWNGSADHDGDGVEEGLQEEVEGLLETLGKMLPPLDDPEVDISGTYVYTRTDAKAAYNWFAVEEDRSMGIHNPQYIVGLLKVSIQAVKNHALAGGIVEIMDVPNDQGKQVRIVWNKTADDGVAIDPVATYIVKRNDGDETWTTVGEATADGSDRYALVVPTVFDSSAMGDGMTEFSVVAVSKMGQTTMSAPVAGYSIDNLVPHAPVNPLLMVNGNSIELSWEAPDDPDINYYAVYRSTEAGFEAAEANQIGTTTDLKFMDTIAEEKLYYRIRAVDFSGNMGDLSGEVNAIPTSVKGKDSAMPTDYALSQNYPNPFNPVTKIDFAVKDAGFVTLNVYNTLGQKVATLVDRSMAAGNYIVSFSGQDLSSGEYFYSIEVRGDEGVQFQSMNKMILMK